MTPRAMEALAKSNVEFLIEPGAGVAAGFLDSDYKQKGARIAANRAEGFASSDIALQVRSAGANPEAGRADLSLLRSPQVLLGFGEPLSPGTASAELPPRGVGSFALQV